LLTTCVFQTLGKGASYIGHHGDDEMCVNYIYYYPKMGLQECFSAITEKAYQSFLEPTEAEL